MLFSGLIKVGAIPAVKSLCPSGGTDVTTKFWVSVCVRYRRKNKKKRVPPKTLPPWESISAENVPPNFVITASRQTKALPLPKNENRLVCIATLID